MNMKGGRMERDDQEDLSLFRELRKRQNEHNIPSLLLCASEEYEYCDTYNINAATTGRFSLYRIPSGRKEYGLEFLETNKSDYDWLKTPPATPLFPSLEMEPSAQLVIQKEIPITQPISRFTKSEVDALKTKATIDGKANYTNPTKAKIPMRSKTPSHNTQRPAIIKNNTNEQQSGTNSTTTHPATTTNHSSSSNAKTEHDVAATNTKHSTPHKQTNNTALNPKKSIIEANGSQKKPRARSVNVILELPKEAPPNLRTSSTTRGRSNTRASTTLVGHHQKQDPAPKACCRPSRSPSPSMSNSSGGGWNQLDRTQRNLRTQQKDAFTLAAGSNESRSSSFFKGSKMVERVVNARKSGMNQSDRETKLVKPIKYREK